MVREGADVYNYFSAHSWISHYCSSNSLCLGQQPIFLSGSLSVVVGGNWSLTVCNDLVFFEGYLVSGGDRSNLSRVYIATLLAIATSSSLNVAEIHIMITIIKILFLG